jgi:hypothetical protein
MFNYEYDHENRIVKDEEYWWILEEWQKREKNEYAYMAGNRLASMTIFYGRDKVWEPFMKREYLYISGVLVEYSEVIWKHCFWEPFANYVYTSSPAFSIKETDRWETHIKTFPNPFQSSISFQLECKDEISVLDFFLYDVNGKAVDQQRFHDYNTGLFQLEYDGSSLNTGAYYYMFSSSKGRITGKIVKIQ